MTPIPLVVPIVTRTPAIRAINVRPSRSAATDVGGNALRARQAAYVGKSKALEKSAIPTKP